MGLEEVASTFRRDSLRSTSKAGSGHPTTCLSSADVAAVLFSRIMRWDPETPCARNADFFVLSKGHGAPLLYSALYRARAEAVPDVMTLREFGSSLEGHPTPRLPWVKFGTGSLGQGLSIGVGIAVAANYLGLPGHVYVLMGDGEMAEGNVYEAANAIHKLGLRNITALVDANGLGQSGRAMMCAGEISGRFSGDIIDGHDHRRIYDALQEKPHFLVFKTVKGKGVSFLESKEGKHGVALNAKDLEKALLELPGEDVFYAPENLIDGVPLESFEFNPIPAPSYKIGDSVATREAYGNALVKLCDVNRYVFVFDADTKNSTRSELVLEKHKDRFIEVGIAEQNMAGMMLGASSLGIVPYGSTFAAFWTRAFDQIRMAGLSGAHLVFAGSHCGVSIGQDGSSQMGLEDIAMMRTVDGSSVFYPSDAVSAERLTEFAGFTAGVVYLRMTREKTTVIYNDNASFVAGGSKCWLPNGSHAESRKVDRKDYKACVVAAGITLHEALTAQKKLHEESIDICVIDAYSIKPLDVDGIRRHSEGVQLITVEDHRPEGGLGEAVASQVRKPDALLAVRETPHSGKPQELMAAYSIDRNAIYRAVKENLVSSK